VTQPRPPGEGITFPPSIGPYDTDPDGTAMLEILLDHIADRFVAWASELHAIGVDR
jgi:hypothetical protein